ncbi:amidase [Ureibacillus thermophilus]|jgi:amidase|uniref:Amidase n=1 Tax=Ureibacillus thermophilus TaxID=367743 RepID=A0A4P6UVB8_9BACL|nr:amidase [Ureibacillus thermophilus]QBK26066.1 amidase [Ureibacillus thermophilus]
MNEIYRNEKVEMAPLKEGRLSGYTFAVKDVFAVEGEKNSAGNPDWLVTHEANTFTAPVIEHLLLNGATLKGLTHTDELMYSLNGENIHYGTPPNLLHPDHIPGGSSSGSASAAAERDFTLGTDTGGSVRVPSSYCGLYGIRPTHNAISMKGVIPLAPSFDTVGWMSKSSRILKEVGDVLLHDEIIEFTNITIDLQGWNFLQPEDRHYLEAAINKLEVETKEITGPLEEWATLFRTIQGIEIWKVHGEWIRSVKPTFAPSIEKRFQWASTLDAGMYDELKLKQLAIQEYLQKQIGEKGLLVIPTTPSIAPKKKATSEEVEDVRTKTMQLTCIAGLSGFPQVTVPIMRADGLALGLSFIATRGRDRALLHFVDQYFGS